MQSIRAICFDLDNTLWDVGPPLQRAERIVYEFVAERYPKIAASLTMEAMRAARERIPLDHPHMRHDYSFHRIQALRNHARECGYAESIAEEVFEVFIGERSRVELYDEVTPALASLRQSYRLFSASNGNADLKRIGLAHVFERSVCAREVGAAKPDAIVFRKVIESTDLQPGEVLFVGDDPEHDVEGARRAGMLPVWMNRTAAVWPDEYAPPQYTVRSLSELVTLLGASTFVP